MSRFSRLPSSATEEDLSLEDLKFGKRLGFGETANVYASKPKPSVAYSLLGKRYAVKVIHRCLLGEEFDLNEQEVSIHNVVAEHENVVTIYNSFVNEKARYFLLERLDGSNLHNFITAHHSKGLREESALRIIADVLKALEHIHSLGVSHLDVKPQNIVFTTKPKRGYRSKVPSIKLVDFGTAYIRTEAQSPSAEQISKLPVKGGYRGTIEYSAPEVFLEKAYVPEMCDMWSVGIMLFYAICGRNPFQGKNRAQTLRRTSDGVFNFNDLQWLSISKYTKQFIVSCLNGNPYRRPTAGEAVNIVQEILPDVCEIPIIQRIYSK